MAPVNFLWSIVVPAERALNAGRHTTSVLRQSTGWLHIAVLFAWLWVDHAVHLEVVLVALVALVALVRILGDRSAAAIRLIDQPFQAIVRRLIFAELLAHDLAIAQQLQQIGQTRVHAFHVES